MTCSPLTRPSPTGPIYPTSNGNEWTYLVVITGAEARPSLKLEEVLCLFEAHVKRPSCTSVQEARLMEGGEE